MSPKLMLSPSGSLSVGSKSLEFKLWAWDELGLREVRMEESRVVS